ALRALYPGNGGARLRNAQGKIPAGHRDDRLDVHADASHDGDVRARLDATLRRVADDPYRGHGAAAPRQHRWLRLRPQRTARALEHPGPDGPRSHVEPSDRLPDAA